MALDIPTKEIQDAIQAQIASLDTGISEAEVGRVMEAGDGIARVKGLPGCMSAEMLEFEGGIAGMALNLERDEIGVVILGDYTEIQQGDVVKRTGKVVEVPTGPEMLGRVVNAIGQPVDGKGPINASYSSPVERKAPGVIDRQPVHEPLQTGVKSIDAMIPIGRGQRELVIGDRQTGKTAICIDAIINQKDQDVKCIYVAVGQKQSTVVQVQETLEQYGAMDNTIIVAANASEPAAMQFIAPYAGAAMGEYFRDNGQHALIVYDDLSKQAVAYRQMSLLLRRPPGREAYPGDVFNLHSRLLERACKVNDELGAGSLTALPIIETQAGDFSAYIPTNVISITDGQIYLEGNLFYQGVRPAVNVGLSVSRVGGSAQIGAMKKVAGTLRLALAQHRELAAFAQFGSELDASTQAQLTRGDRLVEVLKQDQYVPMSVEKQVIIIAVANHGILDDVPLEDVKRFEASMHEYFDSKHPGIGSEIREKQKMTDELSEDIKSAAEAFKAEFLA